MDLSPFHLDKVLGSECEIGAWPICTFYTVGDGRGYDEEARQWNESFRGVDRIVGFIKGPDTWREACYLKPQFLYAVCKALQGQARSVTWIDADARLADAAQLQDLRMNPRGDVWVRRRANERGGSEVLGGTIKLNLKNAERVLKFLSAWTAALSGPSDQPALADILEQQEACGLDVRYMGPELCWIFDSDAVRYPALETALKNGVAGNRGPAVIHMQASRTRRNLPRQKEMFK